MAKHTRPFTCSACGVRPFGDKASLQRHRREVHQLDDDDRPYQEYQCPEKDCRRNRRGFAGKWNMIEHYKRMHGSLNSQLSASAGSPGAVSSISGLSDADSSRVALLPDSGQKRDQKSALQKSLQGEVQKLVQAKADIDPRLITLSNFLQDMFSPQ